MDLLPFSGNSPLHLCEEVGDNGMRTVTADYKC
jgi:hypothetical protein